MRGTDQVMGVVAATDDQMMEQPVSLVACAELQVQVPAAGGERRRLPLRRDGPTAAYTERVRAQGRRQRPPVQRHGRRLHAVAV
jgi:hypothetical protein